MLRWSAFVCVLWLAGLAGNSEAVSIPAPHVNLTPTVGVARWDTNVLVNGSLENTTTPMVGFRAGYAPVSAFSGELVFLTAGTDATLGEGASKQEGTLRTVQTEVSFLVNFQSLVNARFYPYLNLGLGASFLSGFESTNLGNHLTFHIGGGFKYEFSPRLGLRAGVRDTFFNETQSFGDVENQVTVDSVEISLALDYRIPLSAREGRGKRLR